jgi:16S rRNA (guanine966-N2)-methyltransferase
MRIVGGACKKRSIKVPKKGVRPTKSIVRAAIFNIIGDKVADAEVLDIFAGSGALGIEAISRGAQHCTFVERESRVLWTNIENLSLGGKVTIISQDFRPALKKLKEKEYDLIFADPPYNKRLAQNTLTLIERYGLLRSTGFLIIEHSPREGIVASDALSVLKQKKYGDTIVSFIIRGAH